MTPRTLSLSLSLSLSLLHSPLSRLLRFLWMWDVTDHECSLCLAWPVACSQHNIYQYWSIKINQLKTTGQPLSNITMSDNQARPLAIEEFTGKQILYDYVKLSLLSTLGWVILKTESFHFYKTRPGQTGAWLLIWMTLHNPRTWDLAQVSLASYWLFISPGWSRQTKICV